MNSIWETTYFWEMIAILGKGFISCLIPSNNRNLQLLSFIHGGFMKRVNVKQRLHEVVVWGILIR